MNAFSGKLAIITGASRGIGPYIAEALAQIGLNLALVARSAKGLQCTGENCRKSGVETKSFPFDLLDLGSIADLAGQISAEMGQPAILVNNAGMEQYLYYQDYKLDEIIKIINLNLISAMELTKLILPGMLESKFGYIVNIASLGGKKGEAHNVPYAASKGGMIMWADALRQELYGSGVKISVICPGFIAEAGMFHDTQGEVPPLLGTSKPEAVARAVVKAIKRNKAEIIVNKGPMKPLLAIGQLSPTLGDWIVRWFGVGDLSEKRIKLE